MHRGLVWPLGKVVKEDEVAAFRRQLALQLEAEERCAECQWLREQEERIRPPLLCAVHIQGRRALVEW